MTNGTIRKNRHLVDRLAEAKAAKDAATQIYDELRLEVIASGDHVGDDHVAEVKTVKRMTLNRPALEAHFGRDGLARFLLPASSLTVTLRKRHK